uniref:Insulin-like domain-containing protein n=1 Tax=Gadus morhua TaxID=8049 RepID=A0A8C4ZF25_GADMO
STNMRWAVLVAVALWCCVAEVRLQDQGYTLRLCGRELLRAVVYTCGGSRWRRYEKPLHLYETVLSVDPKRGLQKRDVNQYLTFMCCQIGCRKSDLSKLC